jgi:hypothetical protein
MKNLFTFFVLMLCIVMSANAQNVNVNPGGGTYLTLKDAFDAINAGTHTGTITVDIALSTVETATASVNYSGLGAANYSSIVITTSNIAGVTVEGNFAAASIIRLVGADNVTLDGRIGGTGRFITVRNNSNAANSAAIWLSNGPTATDTLGAKHNVIRNCEISCNIRVDSSGNVSMGIIAGSSTLLVTSAGRNNDSNSYVDNRIVKCRYGIVLHGGAALNRSDNNTITGNIIGPDVASIDNIGKAGIFVQFQDNCLISNNVIQNVGGTFLGTSSGADRFGIAVGSESWGNPPSTTTGGNYTVTNNKVRGVKDERFFSAIGILCSSTRSGVPTNNVIANNEVYNVLSNGTAGDACFGIGHNGNNSNDLIAYNSIYMTGDLDPVGSSGNATQTCGGIRVYTLADSNTTVKNNSVYVDLTSNNAALLKCCIQMPSAAYKFGSASLDFNNYYYPAANPEMVVGALGTTGLATSFFVTLANWQAVAFVPAQDLNSINADPIYALAPPNFLIPLNATSPLLLQADPIAGITYDILGELRNITQPTIGCYEYDVTTLPVELSSFTASVNNRDVTLNWSTSAELNNSGFDIERKSAEGNWSRIGFTEGHGTLNSVSNYAYTDKGLATGKYNYRLKQLDFNGNFEYFNLGSEIGIGVPAQYNLSQNYPNPFNPATRINFDLPVDGKVSIRLYDIMGREVSTLINENRTAGYYTVNFNASGLSSGIYFYMITAESSGKNFTDTKKMTLIK